MGKKGGKKGGGKKGKKGPIDWGAQPRETYVDLEVRNSTWQSMRFTQRMPTSSKIEAVVQLIVDKHRVAGMHGLQLYLGEELDEASLLRPEEYGLSLKDVKCAGGSINDHVLQVLTYDYAPHQSSEQRGGGGQPPGQSYGLSQLPRDVVFPPLRQWGAA